MCGRFYIEIDERELRDIAEEIDKKARETNGQLSFKASGEVFPTDVVPVQTGAGLFRPMKWGFVGFNGKPVINARSETALEKPMFKKAMLERRCLVPASGYYEWQKAGAAKVKYRIYTPGSPVYFAGCWRQEGGGPLCTFVILTRAAAGGLEAIHDRMPVIIPRGKAGDWLQGGPEAMKDAVTELIYKEA